MVTIATAAILEMINIAKALTHRGYCFCEVSMQKDQPSLRKMKSKNCAHLCGYHGNGSHFGIFKHWMQTGQWLLLFLQSFIAKGAN
jgi:hypothetical protein